jgi:hypothetical protein
MPRSARTWKTRLPVVDTFRAAARTYRDEPGRVVGTAFVILVPVTLAQAILLHVAEHATDRGTAATLGLLSVGATGVSALSTVFYAGVLDLVVHASLHGERMPTIAECRARLPLGRLFGASLLYFTLVVVGLVLCVVPGFVVVCLFGLVGPVIVMENLGVRAGFARSYALTRPHIGRMLLLLVLPTLVESYVAGLASIAPGGPSLVIELVVEALAAGLVASYVALVEVHTARAAVAVERAVT